MYAEFIKTDIEGCYENFTKKYLFPALLFYGNDFRRKVLGLNRIAVGIGDVIIEKCNQSFDYPILMLLKTTHFSFIGFLEWVKEQPYYLYDYAFDSLLCGSLHIVVIQFPTEMIAAYNKFLESKYSEMYSANQIEEFFLKEDTKNILYKNPSYKENFKKRIQKEFCYYQYIPNYHCKEYEFPISKKQEIFNYHLN